MPDTVASDTTLETPAAPATQADLAGTNKLLADLVKTLADRPAAVAPAPVQAAAPTPAARPQRLTEAQLADLVDQGKITQAQAWQAMRTWDREDMREEATRLARETTTAATREGRLIAKQEALIAAHPELGKRGSDLWNECAAAYQELIDDGAAPGPATELAAAKQVTAGLSRTAPEADDITSRTTTREHTAPATRHSAPRTRDVWAGIPSDARAFYTAQIKRGQWKDENDPKLKGVLDGLRARLAAPTRRRA